MYLSTYARKQRAASTEQHQTAAVPRAPRFPCNDERSIRLPWRKDVFIQLEQEEKNRLQKHSGQMSTQRRTSSKETHIKRSSKSVNRRLALSESAKNKQTFEFTNRGISSLLTLVRLQWRISFFVGVFFPCPAAF